MKVSIKVNEEKSLSYDHVGNIDCNFNDLQGRLKLGNHISVDLEEEPSDFCFLPNGNILFAFYSSSFVILYDQNFNVIKKVEELDEDHGLVPYSVTTNNKSRIYIQNSNDIAMTDLDLNLLDYHDELRLVQAYFIQFHKELLYICDRRAKAIVILNEDMKLRGKVNFDFEPVQITFLNNTACIVPALRDLHFFSMVDFSIKNKCDKTLSTFAAVHGSKFYILTDKILEVFNEDGTLSNRITSECFNFSYETQFEFIKINNGKLYIYCNKKKLIII